ncbi:hypothetical protein [Acinetobacter modestus]|uniref:hypothetical protein n=1 Tax=Acinetobacter modestus TaxID=1776740 RepID=UPI0030199D50
MTCSEHKIRKSIGLMHIFINILSLAVEPVTSTELTHEIPLSLRSIQRYLKVLADMGYLKRKHISRSETFYQTTIKARKKLEIRKGINPLVNLQRLVELSEISNAVLTMEVIPDVTHPSRKPAPPVGVIQPLTKEERTYRKEWKKLQHGHDSFRVSTAVLSVCLENMNE